VFAEPVTADAVFVLPPGVVYEAATNRFTTGGTSS